MTMKTLSGIGWSPPTASVNQYLTRSLHGQEYTLSKVFNCILMFKLYYKHVIIDCILTQMGETIATIMIL